jgi:hypothetical protein
VALLVILYFFAGQTAPQPEAAKNDAPRTAASATDGAAVAPVDEQPAEKVLDSERKANKAYARLEARLEQVPQSNVARRNELCREFLQHHGNSIVASRVRVQMDGKGR